MTISHNHFSDIPSGGGWPTSPEGMERIGSGEGAEAYAFEADGEPKVLRLSPETDYGFQKDAYAATHFANGDYLPIPAVQAVGQTEDGGYYAISDRYPGRDIHSLRSDEKPSIEAVADLLDNLRIAPVAGNNYGWWRGETGDGDQTSWQQTLEVFRDLPKAPHLAHMRSRDPAFFQRLDATIGNLLAYCPEERQLVHGDLAGNILIEDREVSAVIDWSHSMYGDSLYDLAHLAADHPDQNYLERLEALYTKEGSLPQNFRQRVTCYMLLRKASDISWAATANRPGHFATAKQAIQGLLNTADALVG